MAENIERIQRRLSNTITVEELIAALQEQEPDARVAFSSDYGDHCHTQQIHSIQGQLTEEGVYTSAYSSSGLAVADDDRDNYDELPKVLIIR
jgi:hypothetical protein